MWSINNLRLLESIDFVVDVVAVVVFVVVVNVVVMALFVVILYLVTQYTVIFVSSPVEVVLRLCCRWVCDNFRNTLICIGIWLIFNCVHNVQLAQVTVLEKVLGQARLATM